MCLSPAASILAVQDRGVKNGSHLEHRRHRSRRQLASSLSWPLATIPSSMRSGWHQQPWRSWATGEPKLTFLHHVEFLRAGTLLLLSHRLVRYAMSLEKLPTDRSPVLHRIGKRRLIVMAST